MLGEVYKKKMNKELLILFHIVLNFLGCLVNPIQYIYKIMGLFAF